MKLISVLLIATTLFGSTIKTCIDNSNIRDKKDLFNYSLRMEDKVNKYGCDVVNIYSNLIKTDNIDIMDAIDEDDSIVELLKVVKNDKTFFNILKTNITIKNLIDKKYLTKDILSRLIYLWHHNKRYTKHQKIFDYFILSALYTGTNDQAQKIFQRLHSNISQEYIEDFAITMILLKESVNDISSDSIIDHFISMQKNMKGDELKLLMQSTDLFPLFLFDKNIKDFDKYQKILIFLYHNSYTNIKYKNSKEDALEYSAIMTQSLTPFIIKQLDKIKFYDFKTVFNILINQGVLVNLFTSENNKKIDKKTACENRYKFAMFGQGNIVKLIDLYKQEKNFFIDVVLQTKDVATLIVVANDIKEYRPSIYKDLMYHISSDMKLNFIAIQKLKELKYFEKIGRCNDCNSFVKAISEDNQSKNEKKYLYILHTSVESQNSYNIIEMLFSDANNDEIEDKIDELKSMSISQLQNHRFTTFEKAEFLVDIADYSVTAVSIALAPFTAGGSMALLALERTALTAVKTGGKYVVKKAFKAAIKKSVKQYVRVSVKKVGLSTLKSNTRLFKNNKFIKKLDIVTDKLDNKITGISVGMLIGHYLFFKNRELKSICEE